jgi:Na+-driven multidrug efflux pump
MTINLTPMQILAGVSVLVVLFVMSRLGARKARRAAEAARAGARLVSLAGRVLFTGAAFMGVQWLVITHPGNPTLLLVMVVVVVVVVVLGVPDLIAAYVLTRALTVTSLDTTRRDGRR